MTKTKTFWRIWVSKRKDEEEATEKILKIISIVAMVLLVIGLVLYVLNPTTVIQLDVVTLNEHLMIWRN